ncbi:MAG: NUDIX hydrolase [bacterium]|nr:NUDIX hydrolase [bacterium]
MPPSNKNFHVGLKAIIRRNSEFLGVKNTRNRYWTLPGGRIEERDLDLPVIECLRRELLEELGLRAKIEIGKVFDMIKYKTSPDDHSPNQKIFLICYDCQFDGGEIVLKKDELEQFEWLDKENYKQYDFGVLQKTIDRFVAEKL